jgi:hypothetical protein
MTTTKAKTDEYTDEDISRLRDFVEEAAEALGSAQRALDQAVGARNNREWERERRVEAHADLVRARAKTIRNELHPGWDSEPGGTIVRDPETGFNCCMVLDGCLDQAEDELADEAPLGFPGVRRQGPGVVKTTMPIPAGGRYAAPYGTG